MPDTLTLLNSSAFPAEFHVLQGGVPIARIAVGPGGQARMPWALDAPYHARATARRDGIRYTSNALTLREPWDAARTEFLFLRGVHYFQLTRATVSRLEPRLLVENTWRAPVLVHLWKEGSGVSATLEVGAHSTLSFSTRREWCLHAVIHGITTGAVKVQDPNARVSAMAGRGEDDFRLLILGRG